MLPREDKFEVIEQRIIEKHVQELEGENGEIRYLRANLEEDTVSLTYCHPYYQEAKDEGGWFVDNIAFKIIQTVIKKNLLITIVTKANYRADLNEFYGSRTPRTTLDRAKAVDIINDLENIIMNKKTRRFDEGIYRVAQGGPSASRAPSRSTQPASTGQPRGFQPFQSVPPKNPSGTQGPGKMTVQYKQYLWPCYACQKEGGSEGSQKKLYTARRHCRWHNGKYRCTMDEACNARTVKEEALIRLKLENGEPGQTVRSVKQSLAL